MSNKKITIVLASAIIVGVAGYAYFQYTNAPLEAKNGFSQKFPGIEHVSWGKESEHEWEAEFEMDHSEYAAIFSDDGTWVATEHEITEKDLPLPVWNVLNEQFNGYLIDEIEFVERAESTGYQIELENDDEEALIFISSEGKLVSYNHD
ncbi:PepSY-like domain-containing protein [Flagellimonas iocasae]|uniref:PepSY-like domain-containing protein n=1 Tax=Flagellimonas iocasae TaxID=2055905 RepID=A0ABW4XU68_9FLAO